MTMGVVRCVRPQLLAARFWPKVDLREWEPGDCWAWTHQHTRHGYGILSDVGKRGRPLLAHRVSYAIHYGPIPDDGPPPFGWIVQHSCDNPGCVNPAHLSLGTYASNNADMRAKARHAHGERNGAAKLAPDDVRAIRSARAGGLGYREIAAGYGVSIATAFNVANGKTWGHIQ